MHILLGIAHNFGIKLYKIFKETEGISIKTVDIYFFQINPEKYRHVAKFCSMPLQVLVIQRQ